jgi:beta-lactam-binding protein with PASTA domain
LKPSPDLGTRLGRKLQRDARWLVKQDWFFALALAFFVGVLVWFGRAIQDFLQPSEPSLSAPTLVGQTLPDALRTADRVRLHAVVISRQASDQYPKDLVIRQDPPAGAQVREGRQISLVVSSGVQIFPMPDLRYETMREVGLDLSHFKLSLGRVRQVDSDEVPANHVVAQDPPPLSSVRVGTVVNVDVSKGGQAKLRVPNFAGLSIEEARDIVKKQKMHLGQIVWTPFGRSGPPRGVIVRQNPGFGSVIDSVQEVSLQVSAGPREAGYLVRQVHATATVPDTQAGLDKAPAVRIEVRDETGTWSVYNAYAQPKQRLDFNLTVVGTAELDVYVNNELLSSTKLGSEPLLQERQYVGPAPATNRPATPKPATPKPAATTKDTISP